MAAGGSEEGKEGGGGGAGGPGGAEAAGGSGLPYNVPRFPDGGLLGWRPAAKPVRFFDEAPASASVVTTAGDGSVAAAAAATGAAQAGPGSGTHSTAQTIETELSKGDGLPAAPDDSAIRSPETTTRSSAVDMRCHSTPLRMAGTAPWPVYVAVRLGGSLAAAGVTAMRRWSREMANNLTPVVLLRPKTTPCTPSAGEALISIGRCLRPSASAAETTGENRQLIGIALFFLGLFFLVSITSPAACCGEDLLQNHFTHVPPPPGQETAIPLGSEDGPASVTYRCSRPRLLSSPALPCRASTQDLPASPAPCTRAETQHVHSPTAASARERTAGEG